MSIITGMSPLSPSALIPPAVPPGKNFSEPKSIWPEPEEEVGATGASLLEQPFKTNRIKREAEVSVVLKPKEISCVRLQQEVSHVFPLKKCCEIGQLQKSGQFERFICKQK